jgi:peptidoglycan/xylan/chitin deacetylase (PgdA/CDA1 family)
MNGLSHDSDVPEVSVVIPTRDRRHLVLRTLESALAQQDVELEVVVVDDGSRDGTAEALAAVGDPRVTVIRFEESRGVAAARNTGIERARGRWIAFLDDDDLWAPRKLRNQLDAAARSGATLVWSAVLYLDEMARVRRVEAGPDPAELGARLRAGNVIPAVASNLMARTELMAERGGFDTSLSHLADWELAARLAADTTACRCASADVAYIDHGRNMRRSSTGDFHRELAIVDSRLGGCSSADPDRGRLIWWMADGLRDAGRPWRAAALRLRLWHAGGARSELAAAVRMLHGSAVGVFARRLVPPSPADRRSPALAPGWLSQQIVPVTDEPHPERLAYRLRDVGRHLVFAGLLLRARLSGSRRGICLVLHRVESEPRGRWLERVTPAEDFEGQLRGLTRFFSVVPADELRVAATRRKLGGRFPVALTFDDDVATHLQVVVPALVAAGIPATFFLTGASLDRPFSFWWQRLDRALAAGLAVDDPVLGRAAGPLTAPELADSIRRLTPSQRDEITAALLPHAGPDPAEDGLSRDQVASLSRAGFDIGFHTRRHDSCTALDDEGLDAALDVGRAELARVVGRPITAIAYPHGDADARVARAAEAAGFMTGFTTDWDVVRPSSDPLLLPRVDGGELPWPLLGLHLVRMLRRDR